MKKGLDMSFPLSLSTR